ncbi:MAG TPA: glycosyltransferase family 2 protein [Mariniflexile sp.]|nr:glycosyltransferase family 2 protein [Mariniflexile sp.]
MTIKPLISIIIPVFNRENLLPDTLNSIVLQDFTNWECILVDDGSMDESFKIMIDYQLNDSRFKAYKRPEMLKKGANSCRNFGFLQTTGPYIKWFDSDDIMLPNHLDIAYKTLVKDQLDFVVTNTLNFNHESGEFIGSPYNFDRETSKITVENFALNKIGWITDDFLGKRSIVENITFNEHLIDGDEYNFFVKMLSQPFRGAFVDKILTHRRIHSGSISTINKINNFAYDAIIANIKYQTAKDLVSYKNHVLIRWFLSGYMQYSFSLAQNNRQVPYKYSAFKLISKYYTFTKGMAFLVALITSKYMGKGYNIMKYARTYKNDIIL